MKREVIGFGVGLRPPHYQNILRNTPRNLDWLEVISENFMGQAPGPRGILEKLRNDYPVALHGVSLSIGSLSPFSHEYLKLLRDLVDFIEPGIISDHLCWTEYGGKNSHDLLPLPFTNSTLKNVTERVNILQDHLRSSVLLENPSAYVRFANNEMTESQFFNELCKSTGCGILLDVNNVYVNYKNLGIDPRHYILDLPRGSVKQFHLAGHSTQGNALIDTHDHPVIEDVWKLYEFASSLWPQAPTLVEWDDKIPELDVLLEEVDKARRRHYLKLSNGFEIKSGESKISPREAPLTEVYGRFFGSVTNLEELKEASTIDLRTDLPIPAMRGLRIYKDAYFLRLESVLRELFPTLYCILEEDGFRELALAYLETYPPQHYSVTYVGEKLPLFLEIQKFEYDFGAPQEILRDIAKFEWARVALFEKPSKEKFMDASTLTHFRPEDWGNVSFKLIENMEILPLQWNIIPTWECAINRKSPPIPLREPCSYVLWQKNGDVTHLKLEENEERFLSSLNMYTFKKACEDLGGSQEESANRGLSLLLKFMSEGLVLSTQT